MKSKLTVFFVGFGAGLVAAILLIGLTSEKPPAERHVSRPTIVYDDTNAAAVWKDVTVRWKTAE